MSSHYYSGPWENSQGGYDNSWSPNSSTYEPYDSINYVPSYDDKIVPTSGGKCSSCNNPNHANKIHSNWVTGIHEAYANLYMSGARLLEEKNLTWIFEHAEGESSIKTKYKGQFN